MAKPTIFPPRTKPPTLANAEDWHRRQAEEARIQAAGMAAARAVAEVYRGLVGEGPDPIDIADITGPARPTAAQIINAGKKARGELAPVDAKGAPVPATAQGRPLSPVALAIVNAGKRRRGEIE